MAKAVLPSLQEFRRNGLKREQVQTFSTLLRAIALGRLPGEQQLSRQVVLTRLLAALIAAIALWVYITEQQNPVTTHTFTAQVVVQKGTLPPQLAIRGGLPQVKVTETGLQSSLTGSNTLSASVDLSGVSPSAGEVTVPVQLNGKRRDVQYSVSPPGVTLGLEAQRTQQFPVSFNPRTALPDTLLQVGSPQLSSLVVTISGPADSVAKVYSVIVAPPLDQVAPPANAGPNPFSVPFTLTPQLLDRNGNPINDPLLTVSPSTIKVTVQVQVRYEKRLVQVLPLTLPPPPGYVLAAAPQPNPSTILVLGSPQAFQSLGQVVNTAPINLSTLTHSVTMTTHIQLPQGMIAIGTNGKVDTEQVCQVYITIRQETTQATLFANVTYTRLGSGLQVTATPAWISIYVSGGAADIVNAGSLHAQLDLAGLGPGSYDLKPKVNMPITLPRYAIYPQTIHVVISAPSSKGSSSTQHSP